MKIEKTNLDSKGRALIPKSFRESLGIREGDAIFVSLDERNRTIVLSQYAESNIYQFTIHMGDTPGVLARLAKVLSDNMVDLIATESHSVSRTKGAVWRVLCSSKKLDAPKIKKLLKDCGALSVEVVKL